MPIPTSKLAQKRIKLRTKTDGTSVTLRWTEWPGGQELEDPTTGSHIVALDTTKAPVEKTATVRAFVHFIAPVTSGRRMYAEVEQGDAIVDFPLDLIEVTDAGDTSLEVGEVVDEVAFSAANRAVGDGESAVGDDIEPSDLENLSLEFGGRKWVQKKVGEELLKSWETIYAGLNINRAMLVTVQ